MKTRISINAVSFVLAIILPPAHAQLADPIVNTSGKYLVWEDYKIEVNQYGGLGRNWPTPDLCWEHYEILKKRAAENSRPPNLMRTLLLMIPTTEATAVKIEEDREIVVGRKKTSMTTAEQKDCLDQWRAFEEMVYVFSGGNFWLRTDVKFIDEPLEVATDEDWGFWAGRQTGFIDKYIPFERGEYASYNAIYNSKDLNAGPHGGTMGSIGGIKGCGTSDTAFYGLGPWIDERTGYVALHEWLNQMCSATSNMMPYPDGETLWNNYQLEKMGYREDEGLNPWPWYSMRRDTMTQIIKSEMWRRWTGIDPYRSPAIGRWILFGPDGEGQARTMGTRPASEGRLIERAMETYSTIHLAEIQGDGMAALEPGTYYFRTYVESDREQEVRLWAAADQRFKVHLNGVMIRDGWGWNYDDDDGQIVEKVSYPTLKKGVNTLVLELPDDDRKVEFRVRFCKSDGSGEQPEGVRAMAVLSGETPLPFEEPFAPGYAEPRFYKWAEVKDDPWLTLPRFDEAALRELTGIGTLTIRTVGKPCRHRSGEMYTPVQHLFFDVPKDAVSSPWIAVPAEGNAKLNNDFDWNWKSLAWLRVPDRLGDEKDVVFLRFDIAEPLMHLLRTRGRPGRESIVGWVLVDYKLAYVLLMNLDVDAPPETPLGLLSRQPE